MASFAELIHHFQEELICSICREYFTNPVTIECGHSFCHSCLSSSWQEASTLFSCPECRAISQGDVQANVRLGKLANIAKTLRSHSLQNAGVQSKCEAHQEVQKLFCEDDQSPVCLSCSEAQKHKAHTIHCIDEAAENFREKFQKTTTDLWRKSKDVVQEIAVEKKKLELLEDHMKTQLEIISSEFQKVQKFLEEEKNDFLAIMKRQEKANVKGLKKRVKELSNQSQELKKRIRKSQDICRKPYVDFLQNMKGELIRNESVLQMEINTFPINMIICPVPGIMEMLLKYKVDITLDRDTANPGLIIFQDLKSMRYGGAQVEVPNNPGRFSDFAQVFGTQSFISSRHYWEVKVPHNTGWCVGISKSLLEDFFVLMAIQSDRGYHICAIGKSLLSSESHVKYCRDSVPNLIVGIFLDYERGEVSFYNVKERSLIFTFPTISFSGPFQPFFCLSKKVLMNDCSLIICP